MSFKKYTLFTNDDLQRLRQKHIAEYNPNISALAKLQGEIESILEGNSNVPNNDKLKLLSTLEQRFNSIKQNEQTFEKQQQPLIKPVQKPQIQIAAPANEIDEDVVEEEEDPDAQQNNGILDSFEPVMRPRVSLLLDSFAEHPEIISFDDQQQLILNGVPIENTNIVNSLKRLLKIKTPGKTSLKGQKSFTQLLSKMNLPKPLLARINLPKLRPPGKKTRVLSLF
jgi:hypothetical protein